MKKISRGFTLVELILAMVILAILGTYTWISMDATFKTQRAVERFSSLYEASSAVLEKLTLDMSQMFLVPSIQNLTYLKGSEDEIMFTSLNHAVLTPETKESEQTEIHYLLESNPNPERAGLSLLKRSETRFIDGLEQETETPNFEVLTGKIANFSLEYSKDGVAYVKQWDTTRADNRDELPKIIKVAITLKETGEADDEREVTLDTFIDIPMSGAFAPAPGNIPNGGTNPNAGTPNGQNPPNNNPQSSPQTRQRGLNPFGVR